MKTVYIFSPLSPVRSGVAKYTHVLATALNESYGYDVHVVVNQQEFRSPLKYQVHHWKEFLYRQIEPEHPVFYQLGNNPCHEYILPFVTTHPGIVVLHDFFRIDSFANFMKNQFSISEVQQEVEYCLDSSQSALRVTRSLLYERYDTLRCQYPELNRTTIEAAVAVGVHNPICRFALLSQFSGQNVAHIPMGLLSSEPFTEIPAERIQAVRRSFNIPAKAMILGSFGVISRYKRIERLIELIAKLKEINFPAYLLLAGYEAENIQLPELIRQSGVSSSVRFLSNPSTTEYFEALQASDLIYSLRFPSMGEFSLSTAEAMAAARPVFLLQHRFNADLPSDVYVQIRPTHEMEDLMHWTWNLERDAKLRERIGQNARSYVRANHTLERMVSGYRNLIEGFSCMRRMWQDQRRHFPQHLKPLNIRVENSLSKKFDGEIPGFVADRVRDIFHTRETQTKPLPYNLSVDFNTVPEHEIPSLLPIIDQQQREIWHL